MAQSLEDLVHRRTDLGLEGLPEPALEEAAHLMRGELGWNAERTRREVAQVRSSAHATTVPLPEYAQT